MIWTDSHLGNHLRIKHGFAFQSDHFASSGQFAVLTPGHFAETGGFRDRSGQDKYYIGPFPEEYILNAGDLAIVMTEQAPGLIGAAATIPPGKKYLHNQRIGLITDLEESELDKEFLFQLFNSQAVRRQLHKSASGTKVRHSSPERIYATRFRKPPTIEQRRIAEILSAWDRAVSFTERLISAKLKLRKGLMQQLLTGKRRFPGFSEPWRDVQLGDVFERVTRTASENDGAVEPLSITAGTGFVLQREKFSRVIAGRNLERYVLLRCGEFSYNKGNSKRFPQGCVYRLHDLEAGLVPNVFYSFCAASDAVCPEFYEHFFESGGLNHLLSRVVNTGVRNDGLLNLDANAFFGVSIPLPPVEEQQRIADMLRTSQSELSLLQTQLAALKTQKKGLMQQLLTGKVRVRVSEKAA